MGVPFCPINTSKVAGRQLEEARFRLPFCRKWNHNLQKSLGGEQRCQHAASPPRVLRGYTSWWIKTRARRATGVLFPGIINESRGAFFLPSWQPNNTATRSQIITPQRDFYPLPELCSVCGSQTYDTSQHRPQRVIFFRSETKILSHFWPAILA